MPILGSNYVPAKIYDLACNEYDKPEPYLGQYSGLLFDDAERMKVPIRNAPFAFDFKVDNISRPAAVQAISRLRLRNNKTEYERKKGRRVEGLQYASAKDRPYANIQENAANFEIPEKLQNMTEGQQFKLIKVYPKIQMKDNLIGKMDEALNKTQDGYEIDKANVEQPLEFIQEGKGKYMTEMSNNNAIDSMGSTIKQNYAVEMNRPVVPMTGFQIYKQFVQSNKTISNINSRQRSNAKARQIIGLYAGNTQQQILNKI